LNLYTRNYLTM